MLLHTHDYASPSSAIFILYYCRKFSEIRRDVFQRHEKSKAWLADGDTSEKERGADAATTVQAATMTVDIHEQAVASNGVMAGRTRDSTTCEPSRHDASKKTFDQVVKVWQGVEFPSTGRHLSRREREFTRMMKGEGTDDNSMSQTSSPNQVNQAKRAKSVPQL